MGCWVESIWVLFTSNFAKLLFKEFEWGESGGLSDLDGDRAGKGCLVIDSFDVDGGGCGACKVES